MIGITDMHHLHPVFADILGSLCISLTGWHRVEYPHFALCNISHQQHPMLSTIITVTVREEQKFHFGKLALFNKNRHANTVKRSEYYLPLLTCVKFIVSQGIYNVLLHDNLFTLGYNQSV